MEPKLVEKKGFKTVGIEYYGDNKNGEIPQLWGVFTNRMNEIKSIVNPAVSFGVCDAVEPGETVKFSYIACAEVSSVEDIPQGMVIKVVPDGKYAVFTHTESIEELGKTYDFIYGQWLPNSGYVRTDGPEFELYDERFCENGIFDIYVPIK